MSAGTGRRALWIWVLATAAAAGLAWTASRQEWVQVAYQGTSGPGGRTQTAVTGAEIAAGVGPLALAALASILAVLAASGLWRRLVALATAAFGAGIAYIALSGTDTSDIADLVKSRNPLASAAHGWTFDLTLWSSVTAVCGVVLCALGLAAAAFAPRWPGMSDRYSRHTSGEGRTAEAPPAAPREPAPRPRERALWDAIDSGEDPTETGDEDNPASGGHKRRP
ncbi:TIGR02234 family membrane protein [Sinosporangium siamense]|uniref:TIGR02234 family membrane protein n=1 Tax=Sinosporangium siamense TaxID=1367973 RepID=A0A919RAG7_9ACTN|nr:TIGR02234 family membrane protein [Sinosporangium siamense]GII90366.1 hypothetical protein Ssi02_05970 [Sinosporangium siamense]